MPAQTNNPDHLAAHNQNVVGLNNLETQLTNLYDRLDVLQKSIAPGEPQSVWAEIANLKDIIIDLKDCVCDLVPSGDTRPLMDIPTANLPVVIDAQRCENARFVVGISYLYAKQIETVPNEMINSLISKGFVASLVSAVITFIAPNPFTLGYAVLAGLDALLLHLVKEAVINDEASLPSKMGTVASLIQTIGDDAICEVYETNDPDAAVTAIHALIDAQSAPQDIENYAKAMFRREIINFAYTSEDAEQSYFGRNDTGVEDWSTFDCSTCTPPAQPLDPPSACGSSATSWQHGTPQLSDGDDFGNGGAVTSENDGFKETVRFQSSDELSIRIDSIDDARLYTFIYSACGGGDNIIAIDNTSLPLTFRTTQFYLYYNDTNDAIERNQQFQTTITIGE